MSKNTTPAAASQSLVTLTVTRAEFAEIRDLVESILGSAVTGADDKTGLELAEAAERVTPAKLRKENARYIAARKAGGLGVPDTLDPKSECAIFRRQAGIVRKLVAAENAPKGPAPLTPEDLDYVIEGAEDNLHNDTLDTRALTGLALAEAAEKVTPAQLRKEDLAARTIPRGAAVKTRKEYVDYCQDLKWQAAYLRRLLAVKASGAAAAIAKGDGRSA